MIFYRVQKDSLSLGGKQKSYSLAHVQFSKSNSKFRTTNTMACLLSDVASLTWRNLINNHKTLYRTFIKHLTANLIYNLSELKIHKMNLSDSFRYKHQCTQLQSEEKVWQHRNLGPSPRQNLTREKPRERILFMREIRNSTTHNFFSIKIISETLFCKSALKNVPKK